MTAQIHLSKYLNGHLEEKKFSINAHIYYKPTENTEASWPNRDSDLYDQYPTTPKKRRNARKCQGLKIDGGEIRHWLVHPLLPQEPIHFVSMPRACLEWGGDWNGVSGIPPRYRRPVLPLLFFSMIHPDCNEPGRRMNGPGRLYVWVSLLIRLLHGGEVGGDVGGAITFHSLRRKLKHASVWCGV